MAYGMAYGYPFLAGKGGGAVADNRFIMLVKSDNAGTSGADQFTIPTSGTGYLYDVETSDGFTATGITGNTTITFPSGAGTHEVRITGDFPKTFFNNVGDRLKVLEVTNWGTYGISQPDQTKAFFGCNNLTAIAGGGAWFDVVTNGFAMFTNCGLTSLPEGMDLPLLTISISMFLNNSLTSLPTGMTLPALTNGSQMFLGNTINTTRYSQLLVDMESGNPNNSVPFHGGNSKYNATGETARNILTGATRLWTITDAGLEEVPFTMLVKSDNAGTSATNQFTIPTTGTGYNYNIETSDGFTATGITGATTITFPSGAGTHEVRITGDFPKTFFNNGGDRLKVLEVLNWGTYGISHPDQTRAFFGCTNLTAIAGGGAWFDVVTNGDRMFLNCNLNALPNGMGLPLLLNGFAMFNGNSLTDLPSTITLPALTNGQGMFLGNTINTTRYSQLLVDLESGNPNNSVNFHGGSSKFNPTGQTARNILTSAPRNWTITDGGLE